MNLHPGWQASYKADPARMKRHWLAFLGKDNRYPRELMVPSTYTTGGRKRWTVSNPVDYLDSVARAAPRSDLWIAARPAHDYYASEPSHSRLWLEIDAGKEDGYDLELARLRAQAVRYWCVEYFGVKPYEQFSANKGFHLHLDHPPVVAQPDQMREALRGLFRDVGLDPEVDIDLNVVGNPRAMPRPPYSMNTGGVGRNGEVFFTVPIDLDWSVDEILAASREVRVSDVHIPYAPRAADVLRDAVEEIPVQVRRESNPASVDRVVKEVVRFLNQVAPHLRDGRKRLLRHLAVPAFLHSEESDAGAREACRRFLEKGGAEWAQYRTYVEGLIGSAHLHDGRIIYPMRVRRFIVKYPDVLKSIRKE